MRLCFRCDILSSRHQLHLLTSILQDEQAELSEGFWREFFLLKPDPASLHGHINRMSPEHMLHTYQHVYEQLFLRATDQIRREPSPSTDIALDVSILPCSQSPGTLTDEDFDSVS